MKKLFRFAGILVLFILLYIGGNLIYSTVTDYQPPPVEEALITKKGNGELTDSVYTFLIWNIGYGGLGAEQDFFYDGGKTVRPPEEMVDQYLKCIYNHLSLYREVTDFFLLQEVDTASKRSYFRNEFREISKVLPEYNAAFATNYNVRFVVVPYTNPMGKVIAGLATYSRYPPFEALRYSFPGNYGWPKRNYLLDRCFLLERFHLKSGKDLVVINTHNSAYDDGSLKKQQMEFLRDILLSEYEQGNYVIVGGDWNQCPPDFDPHAFAENDQSDYVQQNIPVDYLPPEWKWVYDPVYPTNRKLATPYIQGETFTTIIDFYLLSPNIIPVEVKTINMDFACSDHQPVWLKVKLKLPARRSLIIQDSTSITP